MINARFCQETYVLQSVAIGGLPNLPALTISGNNAFLADLPNMPLSMVCQYHSTDG